MVGKSEHVWDLQQCFWGTTHGNLLLLQNTTILGIPTVSPPCIGRWLWSMCMEEAALKTALQCLKRCLVCWNRHSCGAGTLLWSLVAAEQCSCCCGCKCSFPLALSAARSLSTWRREVSTWWISGSEARPGVHYNFSSAWWKMLASHHINFKSSSVLWLFCWNNTVGWLGNKKAKQEFREQ